jgi:hypothetical protein
MGRDTKSFAAGVAASAEYMILVVKAPHAGSIQGSVVVG